MPYWNDLDGKSWDFDEAFERLKEEGFQLTVCSGFHQSGINICNPITRANYSITKEVGMRLREAEGVRFTGFDRIAGCNIATYAFEPKERAAAAVLQDAMTVLSGLHQMLNEISQKIRRDQYELHEH